MADLPSWIAAVGSLLTGGAAAFAAWYGYKSLSAWRTETIGRRKVEVAEQTLAGFYRLREIIYDARAPLVRAGEMQTEEGIEDAIAMRSEYAPLRRLIRNWEFIADWRTKKHAFSAVFGTDKLAPYDDIERVLNEIRTAVEMLLSREPSERARDHDEFYRSLRRSAFRTAKDEEDEIGKRVDAAVSRIEEVCRPVIDESLKT